MAQLSLVLQDVYLFDDTLWENVRIGAPNASDDDIREAARTAGLQSVVDRLPAGWQTRVGEGGSALSGGERQRVSIARALPAARSRWPGRGPVRRMPRHCCSWPATAPTRCASRWSWMAQPRPG